MAEVIDRTDDEGMSEDAKVWRARALDAERRVLELGKRVAELESENDLFALANADLRNLQSGAADGAPRAVDPAPEFAALRVHGDCAALEDVPEASIHGACGSSNVVSCALRRGAGKATGSGWAPTYDIACGGADSVVRLYGDANGHWSSTDAAAAAESRPVESPAVCLEWSPDGARLAAGCMDGAVRVLDVPLGGSSVEGVSTLAAGGGRVQCVAWSGDGATLAAADVKKLEVRLFTLRGDGTMAAARAFDVPSPPLSLAFLGSDIVVSCRGEPFLRYVDLETLAEERVSKNTAAFDTHNSFECLQLAASPDGKFLAAATDGDRHVVFPAKKNDHARVLVGHAADGYTNARLAWLGAGGDSLASNSKTDPAILQWDLGSGKVIHRRERAHETNVRDLSSLAADGKLASCSFDKSAKIWSLKAPGAG